MSEILLKFSGDYNKHDNINNSISVLFENKIQISDKSALKLFPYQESIVKDKNIYTSEAMIDKKENHVFFCFLNTIMRDRVGLLINVSDDNSNYLMVNSDCRLIEGSDGDYKIIVTYVEILTKAKNE